METSLGGDGSRAEELAAAVGIELVQLFPSVTVGV